MTFYNILFALLFIGALQDLVMAVIRQQEVWLAIFVVMLVLNDIVNTSEAVEARGVPYTIKMKLTDIAGFSVLGAVILLLGDSKSNFLQVDLGAQRPDWMNPDWLPPALIFVYLCLLLSWSLSSERLRDKAEWPWQLQLALACLFAATFLLIFARPYRIEYPTTYLFVLLVAILSVSVYLFSYLRVDRQPSGAGPGSRSEVK